jgi:tripartite-type tricarboxylate transporter receptor subunit TctC
MTRIQRRSRKAITLQMMTTITTTTKTPKPIIDRLSQELVAIIHSQDVREKMLKIYFQAVGTTPEGLSSLMRSERDRWAKVIKQTGASAD